MGRFDRLNADIRDFVAQERHLGPCREFPRLDPVPWPPAGPRDIVLQPDLALELGHPETASLCFLAWSSDRCLIHDGRITLIGPDMSEAPACRWPLAKIVLAWVAPADDAAAYERYRAMDLARFEPSLKGYMLRATSQYLREWSRISRQALRNGLNFQILGSALIASLHAIPGVRGVELIFVTRSAEAVQALRPIGVTAARMIQAMNKMLSEHPADCRNCEFQDVCARAADLQALADRRARG
jgi:hypothetical protein